MNSKTSWEKLTQKTRVPIGTVLGIIFLILMHPSVRSLCIGSIIAILGASLRLWAAGHIDKGKALAQSGPYAYTRNPLYFGSFFMALGIILAGQGYWLLLPFGIFYGAFYLPVMRAEEQDLYKAYGDQFLEYSRQVSLFFPVFRKTDAAASKFLWARVLKNREHHNLISLILVEGLLILMLFLRFPIGYWLFMFIRSVCKS
jgi:protein-S-isoprenylcysteine O-methyltransferase Ste14